VVEQAANPSLGSVGKLIGNVFRGGGVQDVMLASLAVAVIALMVLPLPPMLLDALISVNIGLSILLLMMAMYVPSLLALSTFPTLLLFTTLLRLSLNIATTRAILLHADAGQIVEAFGKLVVGGNLIVGVVVFLIIAIVQFIVIAKGGERVAEVGARFTLDALPGKQMSIDAELRAGILDKEESRIKRELLQRESQLYGAMDGAMKFVKGDAIAGLLIALVNILAGISIGVAMKDMSFAQASTTYAILTVGDGLVSQIPSLFVSLAAAILITRVGGDDVKQPSLGGEIGAQLTSQPKALMITAVVLFVSVLVPGFPRFQFLGWALVFAGGGYWLWRKGRGRVALEPMVGQAFHRDGIARQRLSAEIDDELITTYAMALRVSPTLTPLLTSGAIHDEVARARRLVTRRLGLAFPGVAVVIDDTIPANHYLMLVSDVPVASGVVVPGGVYAQRSVAGLLELGITALDDATALPNADSAWVSAMDAPALDQANIRYMADARFLGQTLVSILGRHGADFLGLQETTYLLSEAEKAFPDLVAEAQRTIPITRLTEVLKRLVQEDVPIRNLRDILQAMLEWSPREKDVVPLTEYARNALARQITYQYGGASKTLHGIIFDQAAEDAVRSAVRATPGGNFLALDPEVAAGVTRRIGDIALKGRRPPGAMVVLMVSMDIRRYVKKMIEADLPDLPVLSYQDLTPDARVLPVGRLDWAAAQAAPALAPPKPLAINPGVPTP
jgi:type III secretion protein V